MLFAVAIGAIACEGNEAPAGVGVVSTVRFETREVIPAFVIPVADGALEDFDLDGAPDLAITALEDVRFGSTGQLQVLIGQGNGTFEPGQTVDVPGFPGRVRSVDFNGDAAPDLAILRSTTELVTVLLNDGQANFTASADLPAGPAAIDIALGDITGDGLPDVCVARRAVSDVLIYPGDGGGGFLPPINQPLPLPSEPSGLTIGDANGDNLDDLLVIERQRGELIVFSVLPGGGFAPPVTLPTGDFPIAVTVGDLSADGINDIVVSNLGSFDLTLYVADGMGAFLPTSIPVSDPPGNLLIADVTDDQVNDLVFTLFNRATVSFLAGQSGGTLGPEQQITASGQPFRPLVGDVDLDGRADLVVTSSNIASCDLFRGMRGRLRGSYNHDTGIDTPEFVTAADLDNDGVGELAVTGTGTSFVSILKLQPGPPGGIPTARPSVVIGMGQRCQTVVQGDFNNDGNTDLAVATVNGVKLLVNAGVPGQLILTPEPLDSGQVLAGGLGPFDVGAADMDGDGTLDIVFTDALAERVTVLRAMDNDFNYESFATQVPVSGVPGGLAVADFTGDRIPDAAVSRNDAAMVSILANDGTGRLSPLVDVPVGPGPNYLREADFNLDGRADLVVSNAVSNEVTVLISRGTDFVATTLPAGATPTALLADDLNFDGFPDILVASLTGSDLRVFLGDGKGGFPNSTILPGTFTATSAGLTDIDGDGLPELGVSSIGTTRLTLYRNISR